MSLTSLLFLVFLVCVVFLYYIFPTKWQWVVLLTANFAFYAMVGIQYILYILITSLIIYYSAHKIENISISTKEAMPFANNQESKKIIREYGLQLRKTWCGIAVVLVFSIWIILKYGNFIIVNINNLLTVFKVESVLKPHSLIMPLGISFYTFHAVGYLVDVYRGKYPAERKLYRFLLFMTYFPHIIQGPFSRYDLLGKTLFEKHKFSYDRFCKGSSRILWGFFKKLLVADKIALPVEMIFSGFQDYSGTYILAGVFFYGIQIYADFSGYMDIVCGVSHILGIDLAENFKQPYFAKSVEEFWRRWHITLGQWFRDYVFYPISMSKFTQNMSKACRAKWGARVGKLVPSYFALIFVWSATGLWHGAAWKYLIWGFLNLFVIVSSMQLEPVYEKMTNTLHINRTGKLWTLFSVIRTFILVCFFRAFSRADSAGSALKMFRHLFVEFDVVVMSKPMDLFVGMLFRDIIVFLLGVVLIFVVDVCNEFNAWEKIKERTPILIKNVVYVLIIYLIILFAGGDNDLIGGFIYANF